jgi:predicted CXXCH cytochrome family protein
MPTPKRKTRTRRTGRRRAGPLVAAGVVGVAAVVAAGAFVAWKVRGGAATETPEPAEPVATGPLEPAPRPVQTVSFADGCATAECHSAFLFSRHVHGPVAEGDCDVCHAPDAGGHVYPVTERADSACTSCHDAGSSGTFEHTAMTQEGCLACHDPHVSALPAMLIEDTIAATCEACHPTMGGAVIHEPYAAGECVSCHDPHAEENALLLHGGTGSDHCGLCHSDTVDDMRNAEQCHCDLEADCMQCHGAHATDWPGLVVEDAATQCMRCHEQVRETIRVSVVTHSGAMTERQCVTCHLPHASLEASMLRENQADVCLSCHDEPVEAVDGRTIPDMTPAIRDSVNLHGPVDHGQCGMCHVAHGSSYPRLLRGENPVVTIGGFDAKHYSLCFSCHSEELVTRADSTGVTSFHDGERNLHALHVNNDGQGRSCSACHVVHGGGLPRLMADAAPFEGSDWDAPIGFTLTERGGSCAPGCHVPMSYDRGETP